MKTGIYKIQSKVKPERIYIGSAINIKKRWNIHLCDLKHNRHNFKLQRHYNKYGESDLQFSVLLGCEKSELIINEQFFIDSYNPYFNCCKIAGNCTGIRHSKESREKIRVAGLGNKHCIGRDPWNKGLFGYKTKPTTEETKRKQSESNKGKQAGEKHPNYGKHLSVETKKKISEINKGHIVTKETRQKMRLAILGKKKKHEDISVCSTT